MVSELKRRVDSGKVFLGIKESLKNINSLDRAIVSADCREETIKMLKDKNIKIEVLELQKSELADKLELEFACEVFGLKK